MVKNSENLIPEVIEGSWSSDFFSFLLEGQREAKEIGQVDINKERHMHS